MNEPNKLAQTALWALRAFHFFYFVGLGLTVPLIIIWYRKENGFSGYQIALLTSVAPLASLISQNLIGVWIDHIQSLKRILTMLVLMGVISLIYLYQAKGFEQIFIGVSLFAFFVFPILAILNAGLLNYFGTTKFHAFGEIRSYGTLGFVISALIFAQNLPANQGSSFWLAHAAALICALFTIPFFPRMRPIQDKVTIAAILQAMRNNQFLRLSFALFFAQIAFAAIDNYVSLYILERGGNEKTASLAWGSGVILEFFVIRYIGKILEIISIKTFMLLGIGAIAFRLLLYAFPLPIPVIFLIQITHSIAFAGSYLSAVYYIGRIISPEAKTTAQAFYDSFVRRGGLIMGAFIGGIMYQHFSLTSLFSFMAGLAILSLFLTWFLVPEVDNG